MSPSPLKKKDDDDSKEEEDLDISFSTIKSTPPIKKKIKISMPILKKIKEEEEDTKKVLKVNFYFEKTNLITINPFEKVLPLKMTINDIKSMISEKYDIEGKI